jgi:hypothetical protein
VTTICGFITANPNEPLNFPLSLICFLVSYSRTRTDVKTGSFTRMELSQFLIQAKQSIYAGASRREEGASEGGGQELEYIQDEFHYLERNAGINPFAGEVLVWKDERLYWAMNYYGNADDQVVPVAQIYRFLQQALLLARPDSPYRGPEYFRAGSFTYIDKNQGTLEAFTGEEFIYFRDQQVYHLIYHGGRIAA